MPITPHQSILENPKAISISPQLLRRISMTLAVVALIYAAFAGLRTVTDPDLGWQMATGRWIVQHHSVPRGDVLSYTATGNDWIYPALSQVIFYLLYLAGGFSLISWFSAAACVATTGILVRANLVSRFLLILAVPLIAGRTGPRAELFTTLFFAIFLAILLKFQRRGGGPLYLLPIVMLFWVNTHLGYIAGLGLCGAYLLLEAEAIVYPSCRSEALARLRRAAPWIVAVFFATLLTPFGVRVGVGTARLLPVHSKSWVYELQQLPVNLSTAAKGLDLRDPRSAVWMFMAIAVLSIVAALLRRRIAAALVLTVAIAATVHSSRFAALFAIIVTVIGGDALSGCAEIPQMRRLWRAIEDRIAPKRLSLVFVGAVSVVIIALVAVRVFDLVSNRFYMSSAQESSSFGPGEGSCYPESAARFVQENRLPRNLFNDYNSGGFVAFRLGPDYPVYIDGRGAPFGDKVFFRALELQSQHLDSSAWRGEADSRQINTILVSLDMGFGSLLANIQQYCQSGGWQLAFLDTQGAVFTRSPGSASSWSACNSARFDNPPQLAGARGRAEQFRYHRNAAAILISLGRDADAQDALARAESLSPDNATLHYLRGISLQTAGRYSDAERELVRARDVEPSEATWGALANLYRREGRPVDAADAFEHAIQFSTHPQHLYLQLGFVQLALRLPEEALKSFDKAEETNGYPKDEPGLSASFFQYLSRGRAQAWMNVAKLYQSQGRVNEAQDAMRRAMEFRQAPQAGAVNQE